MFEAARDIALQALGRFQMVEITQYFLPPGWGEPFPGFFGFRIFIQGLFEFSWNRQFARLGVVVQNHADHIARIHAGRFPHNAIYIQPVASVPERDQPGFEWLSVERALHRDIPVSAQRGTDARRRVHARVDPDFEDPGREAFAHRRIGRGPRSARINAD